MGTGALCAADSRLTGATLLAVGTCAPCADGTYGANDAANCALNAVCGKQVLNAATRVNVAATRLVVGTCDACAAGTWALTIADDCVANTVCGFAVGTSGALRTSADSSRTVAGTCAACVGGSWGTATSACTPCTVDANAAACATYTCTSADDSQITACTTTTYWKDTTGLADVCKAVTACGKDAV